MSCWSSAAKDVPRERIMTFSDGNVQKSGSGGHMTSNGTSAEQSGAGQKWVWVSTVRRRPRVQVRRGGGEPGALGRESAPCSQASQSGLWISPGKGLGSLERLRRGVSGLRGVRGVGRG